MKLFRLFVVACILTFCAGRAAAQEQETPAPKTYKIYAVCDAHLDTQWNWDLTHTIREYIPRILFQNLWMLERYPDYKFNFEGGIIYRWMKEYYPLHYARLQKYIDEGRWHISGASWNANDPNMPSAESFIRNILQGQELYKREFGVRSTDIFLPDCFGFGYTLPSLAAHCGLIGFSTQKLSWRKHDFFPDAPYHKKNPFSWGVWYGIDGQSLMAAFDTGGYTAELPADAGYNKDFIRRASNGFDNTAMRYYSGGHLHGTTNCGDKGNSGTVTTARRMAEAMADLDAPVQLISATSDQLFLDYMDRRDELPTYDGELLMDVHAGGCYTSQGAMKYYNRRNEELLGAAERAAVAADWLGAKPYDRAKLNEVWQRVLWHQFHDDLTGTSIADAYRYSWNDELISLQQATEVMTAAVEEPRTAEFRVGDRTYEAEVPLWKGFYGQWGWYGNSEGFMQRAKIGYLGTHRHQTDLGNVPYGFSYMYLLTFDIPEGATTVTLPRDKKVLVYAMTASNNPIDDVKLASRTFVRPDER